MFGSVTASKESAYVPRHTQGAAEVHQVDSDDDTGGQATLTPPSVGIKRASSTDTTVGILPKKSRGAAIGKLDSTLQTLTQLHIERNDVLKADIADKKTARKLNMERKDEYMAGQHKKAEVIISAAKAAGLSERDGDIWFKGVLAIIDNDRWISVFLQTPDEHKRQTALTYAQTVMAARVNN